MQIQAMIVFLKFLRVILGLLFVLQIAAFFPVFAWLDDFFVGSIGDVSAIRFLKIVLLMWCFDKLTSTIKKLELEKIIKTYGSDEPTTQHETSIKSGFVATVRDTEGNQFEFEVNTETKHEAILKCKEKHYLILSMREIDNKDSALKKQNHHAWRRYFARFIDLNVLGGLSAFLIFFTLTNLSIDTSSFIKALDNLIIAGWVAAVLCVPIEAFLLSKFGTTPAKWLFGIDVKTKDGNKPSFQQALQRSFLVFIWGELLLGFSFAYAGDRISKTGVASWDSKTDLIVTHKKMGVVRAVSCTVVTLFVCLISGLLNQIQKNDVLPKADFVKSFSETCYKKDEAYSNSATFRKYLADNCNCIGNSFYDGLSEKDKENLIDGYKKNKLTEFYLSSEVQQKMKVIADSCTNAQFSKMSQEDLDELDSLANSLKH
jgi:uncharacterized RDD family membrane protein YckC